MPAILCGIGLLEHLEVEQAFAFSQGELHLGCEIAVAVIGEDQCLPGASDILAVGVFRGLGGVDGHLLGPSFRGASGEQRAVFLLLDPQALLDLKLFKALTHLFDGLAVFA